MSSPLGNFSVRKQARMTAATEAALIIREESMAKAAAEVAALGEDELRQRVFSYIAEDAVEDAENGANWASDKPDPATMSREDMIELLVSEAGGRPPTSRSRRTKTIRWSSRHRSCGARAGSGTSPPRSS
jgi:hypothetical protein